MFIDTEADSEKIVLVDASKLGQTIKEGKNQKTVLTATEEQRIIDAMNQKNAEEDFSVVVTKEEVIAKNYSFSAGQYFEVKIEYVEITAEEFEQKMQTYESNLSQLFTEGNELDKKILENLKTLKF